MRCPQCGWPNVSGSTSCSKCGCDLNSHSRVEESVINSESVHSGIKATVNEAALSAPNQQGEANKSPENCPKCGYMLRPGAECCPQCNTKINGTNVAQNVGGDMQRRPTILNDGKDSPSRRPTVNPFMMEVGNNHSCSLEPVSRANEKNSPSVKQYEGEEIILTRSNTDADNLSITSKQQAILTYKEGQWYIEDKSEQHTTFVQVQGTTPIKEGDYILLGNRLFVFHTE